MKKNYLIFLLTIVFAQSYGQEKSIDIQSDLAEVSINIESGDDTYNLKDLLYHAQRASVAINKVVSSLEFSSTCNNALNLSNEISGLLDAALISDNHGDGRINISQCKELITKTFYEFDVCSIKGNGNEALSELEHQQSNLRLQQIELELRAKEIQRQLAEKKAKESSLIKQNFINSNKKIFISNVKSYNDQLNACECNISVSNNKFDNLTELNSKSLAEIKAYYLDKTIAITKIYLDNLNSCKN